MQRIVVKEPEMDSAFLKQLDRGIEDVRMGRTLPQKEAFEMVRRIRDARREEKRAEQAVE